MEGFRGRPRRGTTVYREVWRVQDRRSKRNSKRKGKAMIALRNIYGEGGEAHRDRFTGV